MEEIKVYIWHIMLWEFKSNKNAVESDQKIQNWISRFQTSDTMLRKEHRQGPSLDLDQNVLKNW